MSFDIAIQKVVGKSTSVHATTGKKELFEETYDGTHAGWHAFLSAISREVGIPKDNLVVELKNAVENYVKVDDAAQFEPFLNAAISSGKMGVRATDKKHYGKQTKEEKGSTSTPTKDVEKGHQEKEHKKGCNPIKGFLLVIIYILLFAFWIVGLAVSLVIDLFWLPIKCICPLCCPCICCAEEITKDVFGLVLWVVKLPVTISKKILD